MSLFKHENKINESNRSPRTTVRFALKELAVDYCTLWSTISQKAINCPAVIQFIRTKLDSLISRAEGRKADIPSIQQHAYHFHLLHNSCVQCGQVDLARFAAEEALDSYAFLINETFAHRADAKAQMASQASVLMTWLRDADAQKVTPQLPPLLPSEVEILRAGSLIDGVVYLPWDASDENVPGAPLVRPEDGSLLPLAPKQVQRSAQWRRPTAGQPGSARGPCLMVRPTCTSVRQTVVGDCSFVCSLCTAAGVERRYGYRGEHWRLITGLVHPGRYNAAGRYNVKLHFNGCWRKVPIDDYLPTDPHGRLLCSHSCIREELWVSLLEKAYLRVRGGYDFGGSNSGIDLSFLCGWIPEKVEFADVDCTAPHRPGRSVLPSGAAHASPVRSDDNDNAHGNGSGVVATTDADPLWERLHHGHALGYCMMTLSTKSDMEAQSAALGLLSNHAYAILDVVEVRGLRLLRIKNPWTNHPWTGPYSRNDTARLTAELKQALHYDDHQADNGIFLMAFVDVLRHFRCVTLSWSPDLFPHQTAYHGLWSQRNIHTKYPLRLAHAPQYVLELTGGASVWVLLSQHFVSAHAQHHKIALNLVDHGESSQDPNMQPERVACFSRSAAPGFQQTVYCDDLHVLLRVNLAAVAPGHRHRYTIVICVQDSAETTVGDLRYTMRFYADRPFVARPLASATPGTVSAAGTLIPPVPPTPPAREARILEQPQYRLEIRADGCNSIPLAVWAESALSPAFGTALLRADGERADLITGSNYLGDASSPPGDPTLPACSKHVTSARYSAVRPGRYTLAVYPFKHLEHTMDFCLHVSSPLKQARFDLRALPPEGHGMHHAGTRRSWTDTPTRLHLTGPSVVRVRLRSDARCLGSIYLAIERDASTLHHSPRSASTAGVLWKGTLEAGEYRLVAHTGTPEGAYTVDVWAAHALRLT